MANVLPISSSPKSLIDIVSIVESRARIAGHVQTRDRDFIISSINECYFNICSERPWRWLKQDRAFNFNPYISNGTVSVTEDSREVIFSIYVVDENILGRTIRFGESPELYRIVGYKPSTNACFLDSNFVGSTNVSSAYKLFQYEFALPPDCDVISNLCIDGSQKNLEELDSISFNRHLYSNFYDSGDPYYYCRDGDIFTNTYPKLNEMILDYDFLSGNLQDKVERIRLLPISPDRKRVIRLSYSRRVDPLVSNTDEPLIPLDDRWVLVYGALEAWYRTQGSASMSDREGASKRARLAEMRQEYHATDSFPKLVLDTRRYLRGTSIINR